MSIGDELERLTKLHDQGALSSEEFEKAKSNLLSAPRLSGFPFQGIRRQSTSTFFGLPLWAVALGPDPSRGELRGHARGIFAVGDIATGWVALGGLARGIVALGGLSVGLFAFGGAAVGMLTAVGGGAVGGLALGGAAAGLIAVGGGAFGYYAMGGAAIGVHTVSALHRDPEAIAFFREYLPWLSGFFRR